MPWYSLLIIDFVIGLILWAVLRSRNSETGAMFSNDYEFYESLHGEDQKQYWEAATRLDKQLFVMLFLLFNLCWIFSNALWFVGLCIMALLGTIIWYVKQYRKLKQYYEKRRF